MAISNDERREVAARLRSITDEEFDAPFDELLMERVGGNTFTYPHETDEKLLALRLADLIEPEPERTTPAAEKACRFCGEPLYHYGYYGELYEYGYCSGCGSRVKEEE